MSSQFLYEDGQGNAYDEEGHYAVDVEMSEDDAEVLECLLNLGSYQQYQKDQKNDQAMEPDTATSTSSTHPKQPKSKTASSTPTRTTYTDMQKYKVIWLMEEKRLNAAEAGRQVGMNERVAQRLAKEYYEDPERRIPTGADKKKRGPKPALFEEAHKDHVTRFIDDNSTATVTDVMNSLTAAFEDLKINKTTVNRFMKEECKLSFKKVHLQPLKRNGEDAIEKRYTWAMEMATTDKDFLKNCVFIDESAFSINLKRTY
ncbi:hypothetical protein BDB00DRAFT_748178, partial [Zychaea mexicana]|uniref:uncharacterized protein n=1 Tax=Zychaea mexicana TaxID=64656 RepID=UPI0022FEB7D6